MLGFTKIYTKKPVKILYKVIGDKFPTESSMVFTNTNSFKDKIKELKLFVRRNEQHISHPINGRSLNEIINTYL